MMSSSTTSSTCYSSISLDSFLTFYWGADYCYCGYGLATPKSVELTFDESVFQPYFDADFGHADEVHCALCSVELFSYLTKSLF